MKKTAAMETAPQTETAQCIIGLDIGFGDVKVASQTYEGINTFKFPTAVAVVPEAVVEFASSDKEYLFEGRKYFVGDKALRGAIPTRSFSFLEQYAPLLAYKAVRELGVTSCQLAVGLPLAYFDAEHRALLQKALSTICVDGEELHFDVSVLPQGAGCLLDYRLDEFGADRPGTEQDGIVIDIGFNTVDVVAFFGGRSNKQDSAMLDRQGVSVITQEIAALVQKRTKVNLSDQEAKKVLIEGGVQAYGSWVELGPEIAAVVKNYVEKLIFTVQSKWEDSIQRANRLIIAGGGAHYLAQHMPEQYQGLVYTPADPEYANARGYLKGALAHARAQVGR